jgi:hypothetical protein
VISFVECSGVIAEVGHKKDDTAVRLKVEENQLVGVFGEIGVRVDGLKSA